MKNKVFSLAELRREAKGQKIKFEMIERYGKTGEAIPERLRGIREGVRSKHSRDQAGQPVWSDK